jgi:hypothetical protein
MTNEQQPADQPYRCDFCGSDYTDTKYCCQRRREYLNAHGQYEPADQGRGVGEEVSVPMILWAMRNWADVADRCAVTEGHAPSCIRAWADQLEAAIAALTQPKDSSPDGS